MNRNIQNKLDQYTKMAKSHEGSSYVKTSRIDNLNKVIRTKDDGAIFLAELKIARERSK